MPPESQQSSAPAQAADPGDPVESTRMTLGDHLDELRRRLMIGMGAVLVAFVVAWSFRTETRTVVERPFTFATTKLEADLVGLREAQLEADPSIPRDRYFDERSEGSVLRDGLDDRLQTTGVGENFLVDLKACFYMALFVGGPVLLWQLWRFVAAGLYRHEQLTVLSYFPVSVALFIGGVLFGYFVMVPYAIYFLNAGEALLVARMEFKANEYFAFLSTLCIGLGVVFQLPVLMTALARVGVVEPKTYARYRGHFILGAFVLAAIFTPPDPYTQVMMAGPTILLFEFGILTARLAARKLSGDAATGDAAGDAAGAP